MSDTEMGQGWGEFVERMNETWFDAVEQNAAAQAAFVESWLDATDDSWDVSTETAADGMEGYARAYEAWMRAAEQHFDRAADAMAGESVTAEDFRDIWLSTANEAFKEVMETRAFSAATGDSVADALELQRQVDETTEETLHALGLATDGDVEEVGARLVELERRQHAVEEKLDRVLAAVEESE